jgi:hypothetical protein
MNTLFAVFEAAFVAGAVVTIMMIVREVFWSLNAENQAALRGPWIGPSFRVLRKRDRAISDAWNQHVQTFPRSRKRIAFAICIVGAFAGPVCYALALAFFSQ